MSLTLSEYPLHDAVGHLLRHYHYFQILDALTDHLPTGEGQRTELEFLPCPRCGSPDNQRSSKNTESEG